MAARKRAARKPRTTTPPAEPDTPEARRARAQAAQDEARRAWRRDAQLRQAAKLVTTPCAPPHSRKAAAGQLLDNLEHLPADLQDQAGELEAAARELLG